MKYATKKNISKLLSVYKKAYDQISKMDKHEAIDYLEVEYLDCGICAAFDRHIEFVFHRTYIEMCAEFKIKANKLNWNSPDFYYYTNGIHPKAGLKPRIRHLEKLLNNLSTSNNNSK